MRPPARVQRGNWSKRAALDRTSIAVVCPGCGYEEALGPEHVVARDGLVEPDILCLIPSCGFDGSIWLESWDPEITAIDQFPGMMFGVGGVP